LVALRLSPNPQRKNNWKFSVWGPGEPNGGGSENALHLLSGEFWNDVGATYPNNRGYIVEFSVLPGDFDIDSDVDGNDFLTWQRHLGGPGNHSQGDADGDGNVTDADLGIWKQQFGPAAVAPSAAVPEPASALLALMAAAIVFVRCRLSGSRFARTRCD
jgi:hypothetical protein